MMDYAKISTPPPRMDRSKWRTRIRGPNRLFYVMLLILVLGVALTILNIIELNRMKEERQGASPEAQNIQLVGKHPVLWIYKASHDAIMTGFLKHVYAVFQRVGFVLGDEASDWEVLWTHNYPFSELSRQLAHLKPYQKVNHFPGTGFITNKASLAATNMTYIPRAFMLPQGKQDFLDYAAAHPQKLWVQKSNNHRGIEIKKVADLELSKGDTFIQEYISNPLLIDNRKFDIGVYAVLTSVNPLRVYIVEDNYLFRFCPQDYNPFDPTNVDKYVIREDYTPIWQMPSLKQVFADLNFNFKDAFNHYLEQKGVDHKKVWKDIHNVIVSVYREKEPSFIASLANFKSTRNFFEMVRFDFVLDDNFRVFLMEANMSPNLSSAHFPPNAQLYEHVLFNLLSLVGIARSVSNNLLRSPEVEEEMMASDKDIQVFPDYCSSQECLDRCQALVCKLCHKCLTQDNRLNIKLAYLEHIQRRGCRRLFPPALTQSDVQNMTVFQQSPSFQLLSDKNKLMVLWFAGKCRQNAAFCF